MKPPSTALLRAFSPLWNSQSTPWIARGCLFHRQQQRPQTASFSSTPSMQKRKRGGGPKKDMRVTAIRYHLGHPLTPRPLRFSRTRFLRHWTIDRAWRIHQKNLRDAHHRELQRQYTSMFWANEALRKIDDRGLSAEDRVKLGEPPAEGKETGRLFRIAMLKNGVWDGVPIEYARLQTETPARDGWNHAWTR